MNSSKNSCSAEAVLVITLEVSDTTTNVVKKRIELKCGLDKGHEGDHQDTEKDEHWSGPLDRPKTLFRHETE